MNNIILRFIICTGLILATLFGILLISVYNLGVFSGGQESGFFRLLAEYDEQYRTVLRANTMLRHELDNLDHELDRLEKRTEGVESWLSVIKRRRQLAGMESRYVENYKRSTRRAALEFPHSESIAAVTAAALVYDADITRENEILLRSILPLLADSRHASLRLSLHVLLGDFINPQVASEHIPASDIRYGLSGPQHPLEILYNLAIVSLLAGDPHGAAVFVQDALTRYNTPALTLFAAEYYYDSGNYLYSAELFSRLPGDTALNRQADALWLADYADSARTIWTLLGDSNPRTLYNLALTAETRDESAALLERMTEQDTGDSGSLFGLIRYSRLFDALKAIEFLESDVSQERSKAALPVQVSGLEKTPFPSLTPGFLIDLEILKRRSETGEAARVIADTWMLLDHYTALENLYQWAAWYFDLQHSSSESAILLRNAERNNFSGQWVDFHNALLHIREGNLDAAEKDLAAIARTGEHWAALANLGRVYEARNSPARALDSYEKAAAALTEKAVAVFTGADERQNTVSQLQVSIARCLKTLGRLDECRSALELALNLNPDNINARLELSKL